MNYWNVTLCEAMMRYICQRLSLFDGLWRLVTYQTLFFCVLMIAC